MEQKVQLVSEEKKINEAALDKLGKEIEDFYLKNRVAKTAKEEADKLNYSIKTSMAEQNLAEFESTLCKAVYSIQERIATDSELLLKVVKKLKIKGLVKKVETVDMQALEDAIIEGRVDAAILAPCQSVKEVEVLKVTQKKKGDKNGKDN